MAAFPQPDFPDIDSSVELRTQQQKPALANSANTFNKQYLRKTTKLSRKKRSSPALQLLTWLEKGFSYVAAVTMLSSISLYITTVRNPQVWTEEYENLEALQLQERQLVAINESLKYEIAQKAQQTTLEMSNISPENTVFLQPNSIKPQPKKEIAPNPQISHSIPLGY